jgi:hypothetical protein
VSCDLGGGDPYFLPGDEVAGAGSGLCGCSGERKGVEARVGLRDAEAGACGASDQRGEVGGQLGGGAEFGDRLGGIDVGVDGLRALDAGAGSGSVSVEERW